MNSKNYLKIILPVVAVLIIAESIVLVSGLGKNTKVADNVMPTVEPAVTGKATPEAPTVFDLAITTKSSQMNVGKEYQIEVGGQSRLGVSLDAVNLYVKYDPLAFDVSNLVFDAKLPKPTFSKASLQKSVVVVNYLISEKNGVKVSTGESMSLLKFTVKPKKAGNYVFEISSGNGTEESVTMFVENATGKVLPYLSNKLTVNVLK